MATTPYSEKAVPSCRLVIWKISRKVGRNIRDRTNGSRKIVSPAITRAARAV